MLRFCSVCILILMSCSQLIGDDSFHVYATDPKGKQLLNVLVTTTPEGTQARLNTPLRLTFGPTSVTSHPDGNRLIASSASSNPNGVSRVVDVQILDDGKLRLGQTMPLNQPTGYTSIDRSGRFFLFANYRSGSVGVCRINKDGQVSEVVCSLKTPRPEAHSILTTPDNRFAYVPCVKNNNALYQYAFDEQTG